jgi:hypothetical protein
MIPRANKAYEEMIISDPANADHFRTAHRNFVKDAVYFLYTANREREAAYWYKYMDTHFPGDPGVPRDKTLEQFCVDRVSEDVNETSKDRVQAIIQGMLASGFMKLASGDEDDGIASVHFAEKAYKNYTVRTSGMKSLEVRMGLPPLDDLKRQVLLDLCTPDPTINPAFQDALRTRLNLPASFGIPKTNAPPEMSPAAPPAK